MKGSIEDATHAALNQQFLSNSTRVAIGASSATSAVLAAGRHRVVADVACYIAQGPSTVTAIAANSPYLPANVIDYIFVSAPATDGYLACITNGGTAGTLDINKE